MLPFGSRGGADFDNEGVCFGSVITEGRSYSATDIFSGKLRVLWLVDYLGCLSLSRLSGC